MTTTVAPSQSPFLSYKNVVEDGDQVIVWVSRADIRAMRICAGEMLQTRFGPFRHDDIIGKRYGSQIPAMNGGAGFVHILQPTPELWAMSLPHRTQIVYSPDASYIVQRLRIRPGTCVIEAGTGSGALTHALARTVGSRGRVLTFEYHKARWEQARDEFAAHGLDSIVKSTHRNVCEDGFQLEAEDSDVPMRASAVFLDMPAPWFAVPHVPSIAAPGAQICCFSPCIEQVIKTVHALHDAGFRSIETVENQAKRFEAHRQMVRTLDESFEILRDMRKRRSAGLERRRKAAAGEPVGPSNPPIKYNPWGRGKRIREGEDAYNWRPISWVETQLKSHTAYLTFAVLPPAHVAESSDPRTSTSEPSRASTTESGK